MVSHIELAQLRIAVLQTVHVVRDLMCERGGLGGQWRDRGGEKRRPDRQAASDDGEHGGPPRHPVPDQPADNRIQARGDKEAQADEYEHRPGPAEQLDQAVGHRDAERSGHPDHEGGAPVDGPSRCAEAARLLGYGRRRLERLLYPVLSLLALIFPLRRVFLGPDLLLGPDLGRLRFTGDPVSRETSASRDTSGASGPRKRFTRP